MALESSMNNLIISSEKGDSAAIEEIIKSGINIDGRPEDDHMQRAGYADEVKFGYPHHTFLLKMSGL